MNYTTAIFLINDNVRAIQAIYEAEYVPGTTKMINTPTLFKTLDPDLKVGDFIVVPTHTRHNMTVVKVSAVDVSIDFDSTCQMNWVIGKVDRTDYERTLAEEEPAIAVIKAAEMTKKRNDLRDAMLANQMDKLKALPAATMT